MAVKDLAFNFISAILAVAVVLSNCLAAAIAVCLTPVETCSILSQLLRKRWFLVQSSHSPQILEYLQIILNVVLGLSFSASLAGYYAFLIRTMVTVSFQLQFVCLNWAVELPDYSVYLNDSESFKMATHRLCLLLGFLGLSTQISFFLDIVHLFGHPFIVLR